MATSATLLELLRNYQDPRDKFREDNKRIEAENQAKFDASQAPLKALGAALLAYATGGIGGALVGGASLPAAVGSLASPTLASTLPAILKGAEVLQKPETTWEGAVGGGITSGLAKPIEKMAENEALKILPENARMSKYTIGNKEFTVDKPEGITDKTGWITPQNVLSYKDKGKFFYRDPGLPGGTKIKTILPELNPYFPSDSTNPRWYVPNPPKKDYSEANYNLAQEKFAFQKSQAGIEPTVKTEPQAKARVREILNNPPAPGVDKQIEADLKAGKSYYMIYKDMKEAGLIQ